MNGNSENFIENIHIVCVSGRFIEGDLANIKLVECHDHDEKLKIRTVRDSHVKLFEEFSLS